ncbi:MAG: hypothetical protein KBG15_16025 [Kofleriaceae bacterium]|nr:hypothetical protein [Kofleriaceae bacterium]
MTKFHFLLCASLVAACGKSDKSSAGAGASSANKPGATASATPDPSAFGGSCKNSFDCPRVDFKASCSVECQRPSGAASDQPGYCQLRTIVATVGAANCYGNRRGVDSQSSPPSGKTPVLSTCDLNAGVYCNMETHVCDAVKALGAACTASDDCGKDGACQNKVCVTAGAPGAAPVEGRCSSAGYRDNGQCVARKANGEVCEESNDCQSLNCMKNEKGRLCAAAEVTPCVIEASR